MNMTRKEATVRFMVFIGLLIYTTPTTTKGMATLISDCKQSKVCDYDQLNYTISAFNVIHPTGRHFNFVKEAKK